MNYLRCFIIWTIGHLVYYCTRCLIIWTIGHLVYYCTRCLIIWTIVHLVYYCTRCLFIWTTVHLVHYCPLCLIIWNKYITVLGFLSSELRFLQQRMYKIVDRILLINPTIRKINCELIFLIFPRYKNQFKSQEILPQYHIFTCL